MKQARHHRRRALRTLAPMLLFALAACERANDPAVTIAEGLQSASKLIGREPGAHYTMTYPEAGRSASCPGDYRAQFAQVGSLVVWCLDAAGNTIDSGSTTYHMNFVDTARSFLVVVPARARLLVELERRSDRAVIVAVRSTSSE